MLTFYQLPAARGGKPAHIVIFLHGLGDSGRGGMLSIGSLWQSGLPDTEFICPDAPFPFDMAAEGRQWFPLHDLSAPGLLDGVQLAAPYLNEFIDNILATRNLSAEKLALVGFSQGTMMALYVALRRPQQIAGIVGYSSMLVGGETLATERKSSPPVLLVHGTVDDVVPYEMMEPSAKALKNAGIPVATRTSPGLGHSIDEAGLEAGLEFLQKVLV